MGDNSGVEQSRNFYEYISFFLTTAIAVLSGKDLSVFYIISGAVISQVKIKPVTPLVPKAK